MNYVIASIDSSPMNLPVTDAAAWVCGRLNKPLLLLHTLEKQLQHGADDLSGAIGLGAQSDLMERIAELDHERSQLALRHGRALLEAANKRAESLGLKTVETKLRHGDFIEALVDLEQQARLMVVGKAGQDHGMAHDFSAVGSHIETLIRQIHTSLLIVPHQFAPPTSFMLAYDGQETAERSLERVISGGLLAGLPCHLVMVNAKSGTQKAQFQAANDRLREAGFEVIAATLEGDTFEALDAYREQHQLGLIIMGAFSHSKIRHLFLGSNTIRMIENASVPLIILR